MKAEVRAALDRLYDHVQTEQAYRDVAEVEAELLGHDDLLRTMAYEARQLHWELRELGDELARARERVA